MKMMHYYTAPSHMTACVFLYRVIDIKFLHRMLHCNNSIVNQCIMHASHDANTLIGYKLSFLDLNLVTICMI